MSYKVLITGGTGFVGHHLVERLAEDDAESVVFSKSEYDLTDKMQAFRVFEKNKSAEVIIHMACCQAAGNFPGNHTAEQFYINNLIHCHTLEAWRRFIPHAKLIAIGSSCAYPSKVETLEENSLLEGAVHGSVYSYAFTKRLLYQGVLAYNDQYNMNGSYVIPATLYGEHDDFNIQTAHVSGALVGKFVAAVKEKKDSVEIWGDGTQIRDFMDVKKFVDCLIKLIPTLDKDIVNVGPGEGMSIKKLAESISRAAGFTGNLDFNQSQYSGIQRKYMNVEKLRIRYGISIDNEHDQGLARTVRWYVDHYEQLKGKVKSIVDNAKNEQIFKNQSNQEKSSHM